MTTSDEPELLAHAVAESRNSCARLILARVIELDRDRRGALRRSASSRSIIEAAEALGTTAKHLRSDGIDCESILRCGLPVEQICNLAASHLADKIVVAANGSASTQDRRPLASELIVRLEPPVWAINRQIRPRKPGVEFGGRIILPISLHSERLPQLRYAATLARARGARLTLLHVIERDWLDELKRRNAFLRARMRIAALTSAIEPVCGSAPEIVIKQGDPALKISEEAGFARGDVLVISSQGPSATPGANGESVADYVIFNARCPVVVIRREATSGWAKSPQGELGLRLLEEQTLRG